VLEQWRSSGQTGPVADPWATLRPVRTVLGIIHNVTSATRLMDVLPLLATDHRIQVVFTCPDSSAFTAGTREYLAAHGVFLIDREEAFAAEFDLAIAASYGGQLDRVTAPLLILPHGSGYNKYLSPETGNRKPETGNRKPETGLWSVAGMAAS